jgi:LPXTG-motif cell wall-anchored protein
MNKNVIYIVGATVLVGGAFLFLKNKKKKDADKLAELGGATTGGTTSGGATTGGTTPIVTTPSITEPVKIDKDLNLDTYNLQQLLKQLKDLENEYKAEPDRKKDSDKWYKWYNKFGHQLYKNGKPSGTTKKLEELKQPIFDKLAKLGYKYDNGLLVKI